MTVLLAVLPSLGHARVVVQPDGGKFTITIHELEIGTDTFKIDYEGVDSQVAINLTGQKLESHNTIKYQAGRVTSIFTEAVGHGKFQWTRSSETGKMTVDGKPFKDQRLPQPIYPFGNFSPHLYAYLIAAYNLQKGGPQKMEVVDIDGVGPAGLATLKVTLAALGAKSRQIGGKTVPISRYSLVLPGAIGNVDTEVDTDLNGHVLLWSVPAQKLYAVRAGYEDLLLPETATDPLLSKPTYMVKIEHKVTVTMRDGVKLAADVFRPDAEGKFPVILERTPYGRENAIEATFYAKRGYIFVAQDVRGRFDSEGEFHPFVLEAKDGYDTIEWCAAQPWSTGVVGMLGGSYLGFVQWAAAREGSKHLKCLIPIVSPPDPFFNVPYMFGVFFLSPDLWWADVVKDRNSNSLQSPTAAFKNMTPFKTLPLTNVDKAVLGRHIPFFQEWLKHSTNDAYYDQVNFNDRMKTMGPMPALHVSG
ncbi:MAG: CocE/NonD family hydrolase, partial [Armatimonadota bacterium]|nr:CocE/NonD family hydrolase [Armatimonadota bacterium]